MGSSVLSLLQQANTKIVTLVESTEAGRASGLIGEGDEFVVRIRKVTAKETAQALGRVPRVLAMFRERRDDETDVEFSARIGKQALDDPELYADMIKQVAENVRGLAVLGVTGFGIRREGGEVEMEDVELAFDGGLTPERLLGADLDAVADEVTAWSSSGTGRRGGGADRTGQFPPERPGDPVQPHRADDGAEPDAVPGQATS